MKTCKRCGKEKHEKSFYKDKHMAEGLDSVCKDCRKEAALARYESNKEEILRKVKEYRDSNKETVKQRKHDDYQRNKEKRQATGRKWRENHPEEYKRQGREYNKKRKASDIAYRIRCHLRTRLYKAVVGILKAGSAVKDLGCTVEELKSHLSSKFAIGMSWENYGEWHIDHIRPLASFDLTDPEQFKQACHFTNLQPLWAKDNLSKSDKV